MTAVQPTPIRSAFDWCFRSRQTGQIVVAQAPNLSLGIFIAAVVFQRLVDPSGAVGTAVKVIALAAIVWWSVDEIVRGVNPWRRALGAGVLVLTLVGLATR